MNETVHYSNRTELIPPNLPGGFFIYNADKEEKILFADENVIHLFGCETFEQFLELTGGSFQGMVHPDDLHKIENQIQAQTMFGERRHDYVRYRIIRKDGLIRYIEDFGHLLHNEEGKSFFYVFIVDVDQNEFLNRNRNSFAEAEVLTMNEENDQLTGLYNMSYFYQHVQQLMNSQEGLREELSIIHFDIPNFKLFNEQNGFQKGDELLCETARIIREVFENGTVARFSNDHFVVCAPGAQETIVEQVEQVHNLILMSEDPVKHVRIKAGIYFLDDRYTEVSLACDHARLACSAVKHRHDINYCIYDDMLRDRLRRQQYIIDNIDEAIEKEYLKIFYQPVIRVQSGEICGYEALVRWKDESFGLISPGEFVETLEQFHLIHIVDRYVIRKVAEEYRRLKDAGEPVVPVSINLSRLDFELCDVFSMIEGVTKEFDMPKDMMEIEITESVLNDNIGFIREECEKLREAGYHIWLDDFGSGYSSLNTLTEYNFDVLKLDLVFLRSYDHNPKTAGLLTLIVKGAEQMGLEPLCEGVETKEHYEFLKKIGCTRAQGYYFGKPMPMEETRAHTRANGLTFESEETRESLKKK